MSREDLAALTKIPIRSIERLEDGAFDRQADGFARGFVRTVAHALGLDVDEAVMRLLGEPADPEEERGVSNLALRRWGVVAALVAALSGVGFSLWLLWTGARSDRGRAPGDDIVYRRDVVRDLAEEVRRGAGAAEPLDSPRAEDPH